MPRGDGMGPMREGPGTGRGLGMGIGRGRGRMGGSRPGVGPVGECICPVCGTVIPHQRGIPCYQIRCPQCGAEMVRK